MAAAYTEALRARVIGLLSSKPVQQIKFTFGSIEVNFAGFMSVCMALATNRISVDFGNVPPDAGASYDPIANVMEFPHPNYGTIIVFEKQTIVHESVHAMLDLRATNFVNIPVITKSEDEGAAYVAGAIFHLMHQPPDVHKEPAFVWADAIAKDIMAGRYFVVPERKVWDMRNAVVNSSTYKNRNLQLWEVATLNGA